MKRMLSLLLVAALVLSVPVMPVFAQTTTTTQEDNVTPVTDACPCGCGKTIEEIEWTPLPTKYFGSAPEGHHYLTQDFVQGEYGTTIIAGTNVVIDLRGHQWTSSSTASRIFTVQGNLWIMDTVGGGKLAPKLKAIYGGAILIDAYETASPSFTLVSGTLTAAEGSGLPGGAGFVYAMEDSRFIMTGGVVENIHAKDYGGAIMASGTASIEILGGVIRDCSAGIRGGAVYSASTTDVVIKNTTFINNTVNVNTTATNGGGAVYCANSKLTVENCTFMNNSSTTASGGAIQTAKGLEMKDSLFIGNCAVNGGDLYLRGTAASTIDNCTFYGAQTTENGGSIYASATTLTLKNSTVKAAVSQKWGGGVAVAGGTLNATNTVFEGCSAMYSTSYYNGGGNLYAASSATANLTNCTLKNGFSENQGGNIFVTGATVKLKDTTVTGGVAKTGDNIKVYNGTTSVDGGTINGDAIIEKGSLTLKNAAKIGINGAGLVLNSAPTVTASELTEGAEIYVQHATSGGTVAAAGANIEYFKGAFRSVLSGGGTDPIIATTAADGEVAGYCPHCDTQVAWNAFSTANLTTGHYYLSANMTASVTVPATEDMVLDLNGKTLTGGTTSRTITNLGKLAIVDSGAGTYNGTTQWNGGVIKGSGASNNGGVVHNNGTLKLYGGTLQYEKDDARVVERGGVFYNFDTGKFYMYGGLLDGSAYNNTSATGALVDDAAPAGIGGAFYQCQSSTFEMSAGVMKGGTAYNGATAGFDPKVTTTITGGIFLGGTASNCAGNMYFYGTAGTGNIQISNAVILGGSAAKFAGSMRPGKYATNTFENCYIAGGKATGTGAYGGNISVGTSNVTYTDCVIYGGSAKGSGGNAYSAGLGGMLTFDGCLITGGTAGYHGGNIMFNHGIHKILGGEISYGTAGIDGGNIQSNAGNHASGGTHKLTINKNSDNQVPQIFGGTAKEEGGNLFIAGTVDLLAASIFGGKAGTTGQDIQLSPGTAGTNILVTVGNGVTGGRTGAISMKAAVPDPIYGEAVPNTASTGLNENANIILEGTQGKPSIQAKDGVLYVAGAKGVDADGKEVWYADYDAAVAAAVANGTAVKLYADAELNLTQDAFVDLNGHTATVSGNGKLLGMDSSGDDYSEPTGKLTFTGTAPVADKSMVYAPNGNKYVALVGDGEVTFHRLGADLTSVTINIDKNAVYFKGKFGADDTLKALIDTYGIAVSLSGMPDQRLTDSLKSTYEGSKLTNGETASGVYITNILKDGLTASQNNNRGRDKIYATAYVTLNDGTTTFISDDSTTSEDNIAWSLYDAFNRLDQLIDEDPTNFRRYTSDMRDYYAKWKDLGIKNWIREDTNFVEPEDDGVIDVLMIGSSSCYYYVEEMASLAAAAGIKLRVCNVYYSGCPINKYYQDWKTNYADYQYFDTTAEVQPDGTIKATRKVFGGGKTLEWCLAQGEWDIISMQSTGRLVMRDYLKGVDHLEASDIKEATEFMFPYIQSQFPNAHLYIREQSAYQVGKVLSISGISSPYKFETLEDQQEYAFAQKDASDRMVAKFNAAPYNLNMRLMPASQAMMLVREGFGQWEGYDQLCARVGFRPTAPDVSFDSSDPHEGDHGHVGDIGGGQYVEAALWLQVIMQDYYDADFDVRDITWVPTYYYSDEVVPNRFDPVFMREAAYKAAKEGWTPPANYVSPAQ